MTSTKRPLRIEPMSSGTCSATTPSQDLAHFRAFIYEQSEPISRAWRLPAHFAGLFTFPPFSTHIGAPLLRSRVDSFGCAERSVCGSCVLRAGLEQYGIGARSCSSSPPAFNTHSSPWRYHPPLFLKPIQHIGRAQAKIGRSAVESSLIESSTMCCSRQCWCNGLPRAEGRILPSSLCPTPCALPGLR